MKPLVTASGERIDPKRVGAKPKRSSARTNDLMAAVIQLLAYYGVEAQHSRNGATYDPSVKGGYRAPSKRLHKKGWPDISGFGLKGSILAGRFVGIEVKVGKDKPTAEQTAIIERINKGGGFGAIIYDNTDELRRLLEHYANANREKAQKEAR